MRNNFIYRFFFALIFASLSSNCVAGAVALQNEELDKLRVVSVALSQKQEQSGAMKSVIESRSSGLETAKRALEKLQRDLQQAEKKLEDAQKLARSNPDLINKDKLDELQNAHKTAHESKKEADGKIARMTEVIGKNKTEYAQAYRELSNLRSQYDNLMERIVNRMVAERQADYKKSQTVQATGIVACGKLTVDDCKEAALKEAERQAIEQGAVVVVNSITEINNSKLTRDQIRSSVVGKIESRKILAKGFVSDDTAYQIKIEAVVTPGVGRDLLEQMQQTARFEIEQAIGGGV